MTVGLTTAGEVCHDLSAGGLEGGNVQPIRGQRGGHVAVALDAPTHDIHRVVHAEHSAIVAGLGCASEDLGTQLRQDLGHRQTIGIGSGGVARRESLADGQIGTRGAVHQVVAGSKEGPSTPLVIHVDPAWHPRNGKVFLKAA